MQKIFCDRNNPGITADTPPGREHTSFARFCNRMIRNEFSDASRRLLTTGRLVFVPKAPPSTKYRAVTVECVTIRIMTGITTRMTAPKYLGLLLPEGQLGSSKRGMDIVIRYADQALDDGMSLMTIDSTNAFLRERQAAMFEELKKASPEEAALFRFLNQQDVDIRDSLTGDILITRQTGVSQGGGNSGNCYMLAQIPKMKRLNTMLRQTEDIEISLFGADQIKRGTLFEIYDDVFMVGMPSVVSQMAGHIEPLWVEFDSLVNIPKCVIAGKEADCYPGDIDGFQINREGTKVLGTYVGESGYKHRMFDAKVDSIAPPVKAFQYLRLMTQFLLTKYCYNPKLGHMVATSKNVEDTTIHTEKHDLNIHTAIAKLGGAELTDTVRTIIVLPMRETGLGVLTSGGMVAETSIQISKQSYFAYIAAHQPQNFGHVTNNLFNAEITIGGSQNIAQFTGLNPSIMATLTVENIKRVLRTGTDKAYKGLAKQLLAKLADEPRTMPHAAHLQSCWGTALGVHFLESKIARDVDRWFSNKEYAQCLRWHLGLGTGNNEPPVIKCMCRQEYESEENKEHATRCQANKGLMTIRHNRLRDKTEELFHSLLPLAAANDILHEQTVGQVWQQSVHGGPDVVIDTIADLTLVKGATKYVIDIAVVSPSAKEYLRVNSHIMQDRAALREENKKRSRYARVNHSKEGNPGFSIPSASVIPFVFENTGRLSPSALLFLNMLCGVNTYKRSLFLYDCAMICSRFTGQMTVATRNRHNADPLYGG